MRTFRALAMIVTLACVGTGYADLNADLFVAARTGDGAKIAGLIAAGADVNARDALGETPLHVAAARVRVDAIAELLAAGADPNACDAEGQTPLHVLGTASRPDVDEVDALIDLLARSLIDHGADPNALNAEGVAAWPRVVPPPDARQPSGYPTYDAIATTLLNYQTQYPAICERVDLGATSTNKRLYALHISDNLAVQEDEPEFHYISTMHGDEVTGVVMCLNLISWLVTNYGTDARATNLVDNVDIWIMPCMNPYGYANNTRTNANGIDLNRNFPEGSGSSPDPNTTTGRAPEVADIMNWCFAHSFTLAANFHGGALVANYPFDNDGLGSVFSPTPDEDLFVAISLEYSEDNLPMYNSTEFSHGITNGAAWYTMDGGMQDWAYRYMGCNEVTFEISTTKSPAYSQMPTFWSQNQESMISYMETCLIGIRGIVTDALTGAPLAATVTIVGRNHNVYTDPDVGDYHRMLLPGTYDLHVAAPGYDPLTIEDVVVNAGNATRVDVALAPPPQITAPNGGESLTQYRPATITWTGHPTAQFQVQYSDNYGQSGQLSDGFESGTLGPEYTTGGSVGWYVTTGTIHSGTRSARAGGITHGYQSWLTRNAGAGAISFWYRVSSETNYDWFNFYVDGTRVVHRSGTVAWTQYTTTLAAGNHVLKWEYTKDSGSSAGSDTVWIDDLTLTADQTAWHDVAALTPAGVSSVTWTPETVGAAFKVRARTYYGGTTYGSWDESNATFTVVPGPLYELGDTNCDGAVNFDDIHPFVAALSGAASYYAHYPECVWENADCNSDGTVNFDDIRPFVAALAG